MASIGLQPEEEFLTKSGYRIDALVEANGKKIGIEVDGPSHFVGKKPTGSTLLKHRQVNTLDEIEVISVPYWEWDKLGKDVAKKQQYLRFELGLLRGSQRAAQSIAGDIFTTFFDALLE